MADRPIGRLRLGDQRKVDRHSGPFAYAALCLDATAMHLDDGLRDGESQARPSLLACPRLVYAVEAFEDVG